MLLVFRCHYVSILYRFWDTISYLPKFKEVTWDWTHRFYSLLVVIDEQTCCEETCEMASCDWVRKSHVIINWYFFADENCWTAVPDTQSLGSQRHPATNVTACQEACWNNNSCNGVDWDPRQRLGHQCWLIGPWTRVRQVPRQGITQYLIDRTNCGMLEYHTMRNHNVQRATRLLEDSQLNIPHRYSTGIVSRIEVYLNEVEIDCLIHT